jgi:hypothetical protein
VSPRWDVRSRSATVEAREENTMLRALLIVLVVILLLAALPAWPYSAAWGYYPSGGLGLLLLILIIFLLLGRRRSLDL